MFMDLALLVLRLVTGLLLAGHGAQKLFGWFGGGGLNGTADMMGHLGLRPAYFWAFMAAISEFGGGVLLALGLLSPLGSLGISAAMLMAIAKVHWPKGIWGSQGGIEFPLTNLVVALALALTGPGLYSLDTVLGLGLPEPITLMLGLFFVILGVLAALLSQVKPAVGIGQTR